MKFVNDFLTFENNNAHLLSQTIQWETSCWVNILTVSQYDTMENQVLLVQYVLIHSSLMFSRVKWVRRFGSSNSWSLHWSGGLFAWGLCWEGFSNQNSQTVSFWIHSPNLLITCGSWQKFYSAKRPSYWHWSGIQCQNSRKIKHHQQILCFSEHILTEACMANEVNTQLASETDCYFEKIRY